MAKIWKDIVGYEWLYQISNTWDVKSLSRCVYTWNKRNLLKERILKNISRSNWYYAVNLSKEWKSKTYLINRLVAQAFLWLDIESDLCACHKDDNPKNNNADNLFVWTQKDNLNDMQKKWRKAIIRLRWEKHGMSKLNKTKVKLIKLLLSMGKPIREIWKVVWISNQTVSNIKLGYSWTHITI